MFRALQYGTLLLLVVITCQWAPQIQAACCANNIGTGCPFYICILHKMNNVFLSTLDIVIVIKSIRQVNTMAIQFPFHEDSIESDRAHRAGSCICTIQVNYMTNAICKIYFYFNSCRNLTNHWLPGI